MGANLEVLQQQAIHSAITQDWPTAVDINRQILADFPNDITSLNRLGTALIKTNHPNQAKDAFSSVLKLDPHNTIAKNNLTQIKKRPANTDQSSQDSYPCITSFIEEPGKSKVIPLVKVAEPQTIASLVVGQKVDLKTGKHKISVIDQARHHLGYLPDNLSNHLIKLVHSGYRYDTYVKSTNPKNFQVFIQEIKQSKKLRGTPSFPVNGDIFPKLDAGEPNAPPLEIFDPLLGEEGDIY